MGNFDERVVCYQLLPQPVLRSFSSVSAIKSSTLQRMVVVQGPRRHILTQFSTPTKLIISEQSALCRKVSNPVRLPKLQLKINFFLNRTKSRFRGSRILNLPRAMLFTFPPPPDNSYIGRSYYCTSLYSSLLGNS